MSAYMVSEKIMQEIASRIDHELEKESWMQYHLPRLDAVRKAGQLGLLIRVENEKALTARYGDKFSVLERPNIPISLINVAVLQKSIENIQEYLYQISEGDFEDNEVHKELQKFEYFLLKRFFRSETEKHGYQVA
jgi:hypothetical protein